MKQRVGKPVFFIVLALLLVFTYLTFFGAYSVYGDVTRVYVKGANDIRWGIDIRGGVDATFTPPEGVDATNEQMDAASAVIKNRLVTQNITDYELYTDYNKDRIVVRFPWQVGEEDFDPEKAISELGEMAQLTFREGIEVNDDGTPKGVTEENVILTGEDVEEAYASMTQDQKIVVVLKLKDSGKEAFSEATERLVKDEGIISIWMDNTVISYPSVSAHITDGTAEISGNFTAETATALADKINAGALPFKLTTENFSTISPVLGMGARDAMVLAGGIAFILVALFMIIMYRLPGVIAAIALMGQVAGMVACVTGFFPAFNSFTLTLPGIAGMILSIGMGVDANVITSERIKEELRAGKTLDGAINLGYERGFSAIFDGNVTVVIVSVILMGAFGPTSSFFAKVFSPVFFMFGSSTAGSIYSFGYTLLIGVIFNFVMGVTASRLMLKSISKFKAFRSPKLYGGAK
jgi:protein-export membrane protein SecD